jgi:hypothetical protein
VSPSISKREDSYVVTDVFTAAIEPIFEDLDAEFEGDRFSNKSRMV